jgi:ABC-type nitrate/sulfonate/bicarbonate transport system ATPase subunit
LRTALADVAGSPGDPRRGPGGGPAVQLERLRHVFAGDPPVEAVADVSLEVERGSFVSLLGPSGCGKSTVLRVLAGLLEPSSGRALIDGEDAVGKTGLAAFMPQRDLLLPWRRAEANAVLGAEIAGVPREEARRQARELYERFGLAGFERAWPGQLSGGMRQRLALLRTFLMPRQTLLLDEPFGALDALTRRGMQVWLEGVWARDRRTVLLVTHDVEEALLLSDVVYVMTPRPGRIAARIEVELARPRETAETTTGRFTRLKAAVLEALETDGAPG